MDMLEYISVACAVPGVSVGNVKKNTEDICAYLEKADRQQVDLVVFPELSMTGYTCQDLFFQETLWSAVMQGLGEIALYSRKFPALTAVVGLPVRYKGYLLNCAAVICNGSIKGIVPKIYLPNYSEFSEKRWFSSGGEVGEAILDLEPFGLTGTTVLGTKQLFRLGDGTLFGVEICEDLWSPVPPSSFLALQGAELVVNLSASNEAVGKRAYRKKLVEHQSASCLCAYVYCSAGATESTQDLTFSGHCMVAEGGIVLKETEQAYVSDILMVQDCDLGKIRADRVRNKSFADAAAMQCRAEPYRVIPCCAEPLRATGARYRTDKLPFVPASKTARDARCMEIFAMQVAGLKQRLATIQSNAVIGISGGLDSTLALLVTVEAMRQLGRPATDVYGVTMPCFGTSDRTYQNAWTLMQTLGISAKEINIRNAVTLHFADIGQDPARQDTTYENSQARERTQILMDYAGVVGGIVIGTGDLSELALGWCTYNGDHMSMYGVNASVPKTLIRWIIEAVAQQESFLASRDVLMDVLDTPISPELLPPDVQGKISQQTEDIVGPYALHDFFLFYMLRYGFAPGKIYALACRAFAGEFQPETVHKWMTVFYRRFFTQQFKRDCVPDGVKVGSVSMSPRGDWRMPSDASGRVWLDEIAALQ